MHTQDLSLLLNVITDMILLLLTKTVRIRMYGAVS